MVADRVRVGAVADVHYGRETGSQLRAMFEHVAKRIDVLLLAGDLTDFGQPEEAAALTRDLTVLSGLPIIAILGNHDFEIGKDQEITSILRDAGIHVLDGDTCEVRGIGFVGVKGFGGGFGRGTLEPWGETAVKDFVRAAVDESLKLERALARLQTPTRIALLHYSPIRETVIGEPEEIFPFLGSGRLEEPLNRYGVAAIFHGHAHHGSPEGRTAAGIPVYNVALPVLRQLDPKGPSLKIVDIKVSTPL